VETSLNIGINTFVVSRFPIELSDTIAIVRLTTLSYDGPERLKNFRGLLNTLVVDRQSSSQTYLALQGHAP
jgi:hypothetical protein